MYKDYNTSSKVESYFIKFDSMYENNKRTCKIPVLTVDNYVRLGQLTALRFIEWVSLNPGGVVALPTGKTPEFFIKWVKYYMDHWDEEASNGIIKKIGISKPDFSSCYFFQLDEFFPINPKNERSFRYFVEKYYIKALGFFPDKVNLIDTYTLEPYMQTMLGVNNLAELFDDNEIDLSLRSREPKNEKERKQQIAIKMIDKRCDNYEQQIRDLGGIGFFLGGIGPDGHIAFNISGSSHYSTTRLTTLNYESQAAAASDLGGMTQVRKKAVITMGLGTITYNPNCVPIIIAAGQGKADIVTKTLTCAEDENIKYPASCLAHMKNARFFITEPAAVNIPKTQDYITSLYNLYKSSDEKLANQLIDKMIIDIALTHDISYQQIQDNYTNFQYNFLEELTGENIKTLAKGTFDRIIGKFVKDRSKLEMLKSDKTVGRLIREPEKIDKKTTILHTSPHHDDIELAYFPYIEDLLNNEQVTNYFAYCTSGYTSVTTDYLISIYNNIIKYSDLVFHDIHVSSYDDDLIIYLQGDNNNNQSMKDYAIARRIVRKWYETFNYNSDDLLLYITSQLDSLNQFEIGRKEPDSFHLPKGWIREMEAELVWSYFGVGSEMVNHLRLPFYSDDIFPHYPDFNEDVKPILELLEKINPDIVTVALDPEGSGPDTHFKCLIAISEAIDEYHKNHPDKDIRILGYRNVWSKFHLSEANKIVLANAKSFKTLHDLFNTCYNSQCKAEFPSYAYNGPFSDISQKTWIKQYDDVASYIGITRLSSNGFIYFKEMNYDEFYKYMLSVRRILESKDMIKS